MTKEYLLKYSLLDRERKLILTEDYFDYENKDLKSDLYTRLNKDEILDFKHKFERIIFYKFPIGTRYSITFLDKNNKKLNIKFKNYFWSSKNYRQVYSELISLIWQYYFVDLINTFLIKFENNESLRFDTIELNRNGINFKDKEDIITWNNLDFKEYITYFVIFKKDNPKVYRRFSFDEWNSEILFSLIRTIKNKIKE